MNMTNDRAPAPVPVCADCLNYFNPFIDGDLGVVVLTQEYLDQLLENAFHRGFGAGLAQGKFCDSVVLGGRVALVPTDEVNDEQLRPGNRAVRATAEPSARLAG